MAAKHQEDTNEVDSWEDLEETDVSILLHLR